MGTLIKQELFKLRHKKGTWIGVLLVLLVQGGMATLAKMHGEIFSPEAMFESSFLGASMVLFVLIASTASIISMEFQYGTVKQLLYRKFYRSQVFISKLIIVILHTVVLYVLQLLVSFAIKFALFPKIKLTGKILTDMLVAQGGGLTMLLMLLSVVVLLSTLFKSNAAAITTGYIGYFVINVGSGLMLLVIDQWHWLKWNPLTMMLLPSQLQSPSLAQATLLSTPVMFAGAAVYTVLFSFIAYMSFRKRSI